MQITEFLVG